MSIWRRPGTWGLIVVFTGLVGCFDSVAKINRTLPAGVFRYNNTDLEFSPESVVEAYVSVGDSNGEASWSIDIDSLEPAHRTGRRYFSYPPSASVPFPHPGRDWREFSGFTHRKQLPEDTDLSIYTGVHYFVKSYSLRIAEVRGEKMRIQAAWDIELPVVAHGWVRFTGVSVIMDEETYRDRLAALDTDDIGRELEPTPEGDELYREMFAEAKQALSKNFDLDDFEQPEMRSYCRVWFPIRRGAHDR